MSWTIALLENTVLLPADVAVETARKLIEENMDTFYEVDPDYVDDIADENLLYYAHLAKKGDGYSLVFSDDDMEHMDWLQDDICLTLARAGATGTVKFGSLEGDNRNSFWGYEFKQGHYRTLSGTVTWSPGTSRG